MTNNRAKLLKQINKEVKVTKTEYYKTFIKIWQGATHRQGAYAAIREQLDPELSYKRMMQRVKFVERQGVNLKELGRDTIDWDYLRKTFSS